MLVGDAAHVMAGSYGQASSFAFEDAVTLARCLVGTGKTKEALDKYSQLRRDRCLEMQRKSQECAAKAMKGEQTEDITRWIHDWDIRTAARLPRRPLEAGSCAATV